MIPAILIGDWKVKVMRFARDTSLDLDWGCALILVYNADEDSESTLCVEGYGKSPVEALNEAIGNSLEEILRKEKKG